MNEFEEDDLFGMIICYYKSEDKTTYGTAFIIKQTLTHYIILTAAHNMVTIDKDLPD
jgi:hypothetical protein